MKLGSLTKTIHLKLTISYLAVLALLLLITVPSNAATYWFQGFGFTFINGVRGTRTDIYTGNPSPVTPGFVAGLTAICQTSGGSCTSTSYFFETGWIKGLQTGGVLRHYISWQEPSGGDFIYGVEITSSQWYEFRSLYSYSASRWEGWLNGVPKLLKPGLGFTSGNRTTCGLESKSIFNSVPSGYTACASMRYKVGTGSWTYHDYSTKLEAPYCVNRPWGYGLQAYGPTSCP